MKVGIIMGSDSDLPVMSEAAKVLDALDIEYELTIVSAHRTPERMYEYAKTAKERGINVIIAGAGGAAHLPGMTAALTTLPVIGVPVKTKALFHRTDAAGDTGRNGGDKRSKECRTACGSDTREFR